MDILKEIKEHRPKPPVLILSMHPEEQFAIRAIGAGASGYLTKECAGDELVLAIRKALKGERYISGSLAQILAGELDSDSEKPLHEILSDREYQVMLMIASGKTVGAIAGELCLSVKTISSYRTNILLKTRMKNNAEITHYAIKNELVELNPLPPTGAPSFHRTNTGPRNRQTTACITDRGRFLPHAFKRCY